MKKTSSLCPSVISCALGLGLSGAGAALTGCTPACPKVGHGPTTTVPFAHFELEAVEELEKSVPHWADSGPVLNREPGAHWPIGLYGEGISESRRGMAQPEGRGNLAQVSFISEGACFDPAVDRTGRLLAFASTMHRSGADLYIKTIGGSTVTQLTSDPADDVMPIFSPSGDKIAFASNRAGKWDIYVTSINGGPPVQVTNDRDHEIHPSWSPDGRHIAYCKFNSQSGRWEIWAVDVQNPGVRRFLEYGMFPRWSPDIASSKILFQRPRQRGSRLHGIWTVDFVNGEAMHPTEIISAANAATINPSWSPDGRRIAFVTILNPDQVGDKIPQQADLWVVNVDGSGRTRLTDGQFANFQPVWSGDGYLYFVSNRSGTDNIWAVATSRILELGTPSARGVAGASPDRP